MYKSITKRFSRSVREMIDETGYASASLAEAMDFVSRLEMVIIGGCRAGQHQELNEFLIPGRQHYAAVRNLFRLLHRVTVEYTHERLTGIRVTIKWHMQRGVEQSNIDTTHGELNVTFIHARVVAIGFTENLFQYRP